MCYYCTFQKDRAILHFHYLIYVSCRNTVGLQGTVITQTLGTVAFSALTLLVGCYEEHQSNIQ